MNNKNKTNKKSDAAGNRLFIHMIWAFISAITILYFKNYYTGLGVLEGMDAVSHAAKVLFFIALAVTVAAIIFIVASYKKGADFSERTFTPAVTILWPAAYMLYMCPLAFSSLWFWEFNAVFRAGYLFIGIFFVLYIIKFAFMQDLFFTAVSLICSEVLFYLLSRLILHASFGKPAIAVYCVLSAAIGVLYILKLFDIKKHHGKCGKSGKRILPKTALYFPAVILGILHVVGNIAVIFFGYFALRYSCYAIAGYAVIAGLIYIIRQIYKKK